MALKTVNIPAVDQYSDSITVTDGAFFVSVHDNDNFVGQVILERQKSGDSKWRHLKTYTGVAEDIVDSVGTWDYRIGCINYKSGSIKASIGNE